MVGMGLGTLNVVRVKEQPVNITIIIMCSLRLQYIGMFLLQ